MHFDNFANEDPLSSGMDRLQELFTDIKWLKSSNLNVSVQSESGRNALLKVSLLYEKH